MAIVRTGCFTLVQVRCPIDRTSQVPDNPLLKPSHLERPEISSDGFILSTCCLSEEKKAGYGLGVGGFRTIGYLDGNTSLLILVSREDLGLHGRYNGVPWDQLRHHTTGGFDTQTQRNDIE